uniref:Uncharacterized protein n=1 Tax=Kalanchoe fedtschenkoi TaxID=63787 RepID=A0A7N0U7X8_KALFE
MATEGISPFSLSSVVEDVLKQTTVRSAEKDLTYRKAEGASLRRYEAAEWLRRIAGALGGKDLPDEPTEEEFRIGLRSGIILCNALNRVQPGAVPKVVEGPYDSNAGSDRAALCAYQYFENVRNFLLAIEEIGLPTFEASDLEQGGKSSRLVDCVLALKAYSDWKQSGSHGSWKYSANLKSVKQFVRKNGESFMNMSGTASLSEKSIDGSLTDHLHGRENGEMSNTALNSLIRANLFDKRKDEIPMVVESMICKVMEEYERRLLSQIEVMKTVDPKDTDASNENNSSAAEYVEEPNQAEQVIYKREDQDSLDIEGSESNNALSVFISAKSNDQIFKQHIVLVEQQQKHIQELKSTLLTTKAGVQFLQTKYQEEFNILGKHVYSLAHAASGYQRVLEENRRLYNEVQDLKGNIRVYCRVRPFIGGQSNSLSVVGHIEEGNISVITPPKYGKEGKKSFRFNKVFGPSTTQEEVFSDMRPLVRSVLDGFNVCIFAYGQTGSGKTFTMTGPRELSEETRGVNYRALGDLFVLSKERKETFCYEVSVQMIEIYNEQVRDLLVTDGGNKRLEIRNSSQKGLNVPNANVIPVTSTQDVINLMNLGHKNRAVSATSLNERSSRSHSCLTVHVQGKNLTSGTTLRGSMHLVDLAGSERVDKSEVVGDRLKEAQHINKSLSALGDVISSLAQKNAHVPYRNSKLTQLLQDSLGGQAKTLMFVHISPEPEAIGETLSTLKFAERVSTIELGAAKVNKDGSEVKELKEQIANLKAALARKEGEPENIHSSPNSPDSYDRSLGNSSSLSRQNSVDVCNSHSNRQPVEDVGNIESPNSSLLSDTKQGFDLQDMLMNSSPWQGDATSGLISLKDDDKDLVSGDWEDKVMVNKLEGGSKDENGMGFWEEDNRELPQMFYRRYTLDPSKVYPEQSLGKFSAHKRGNQELGIPRSRSETTSLADSDDLEIATTTSDSSEPDLLSQLTTPKVHSITSGLGSKTKKSSLLKPSRSGEVRSLIPSLIPSPSPARKLANGASPQVHRTVRSADGKRKTGLAK